uniref:Uncharacterized protein n=1 Tax=Aegilops tauschii subsp. strangulata TaxID=200361 RepID=A0A453HTT3_AEGTS
PLVSCLSPFFPLSPSPLPFFLRQSAVASRNASPLSFARARQSQALSAARHHRRRLPLARRRRNEAMCPGPVQNLSTPWSCGARFEPLCENELQPAPLRERSRGSGEEPNRLLVCL